MRKRAFVILAILCCYHFQIIAQEADMTGTEAASAVPTFDANFNGGSDVDISTGTIKPSIPLMMLKGRSLTTGVSVSYINGKGYRADLPPNILDNLGKGWRLNAGGSITRTVKGIRDDKYYGQTVFSTDIANARGWLDIITGIQGPPMSGTWYESTLFLANNHRVGQMVLNDLQYGNLYDPPGITQYDLTDGRYWYYSGVLHNCQIKQFDSEPDIFQFNLNGETGRFIFDETGAPVFLEENNMKIEVPDLTQSTGGQWIIITSDGTRYIFENNDNYREFATEISGAGHSNDPGTTLQNEYQQTIEYISTWNLTRIEHVTGDQIVFTYETAPNYGYNFKSETAQDYSPGIYAGNNENDPIDNPYLTNEYNTVNYYITNVKRLFQITSANGKIEFNYSADYKLLITLKQFSATNELQHYFEIPQYYPKAKLIQKPIDGSHDDLVYSFIYFDGLPSSGNNTRTDYWGYYNSATPHALFAPYSGTLLQGYPFTLNGGNRDPDLTYCKAGTLKKIINPGGGETEFEYELNDFWDEATSTNKQVGGLRIKKISQFDGEDHNKDIVTNYKYIKDNSTESSGEVSYNFDKLTEGNAFFVLHPEDNSALNIVAGTLSRIKYFLSRSSLPQLAESSDEIRYTNVEVSKPGKGKISYGLTGFSDQPDDDPERREFNYGLANNFTNLFSLGNQLNALGMKSDKSEERGLIREIIISDEANNKLKQTSFNYTFHPQGYIEKTVKGMKLFTRNFFTGVLNTGVNYPSSCGEHLLPVMNQMAEYYSIKSRWIYVNKVIEKEFDPTAVGSFMERTTEFYYDNLQHKNLTSQTRTNSDGTQNVTYFKYNTDLSIAASAPYDDATAALKLMNDKNINVNIQTINTKINSSVETILGSVINVYKVAGNIPVFEKALSDETSGNTNFTVGYFASISNGNFITNPVFKDYGKVVAYTNYGQPKEVLMTNGVINSSIYDENSRKGIASVTNASVSGQECAYTGFETNAIQNYGTYSYTITGDAFTGKYCNKLEGNPTIAPNNNSFSYTQSFQPANNNRKYKVSAWVKTESGFGAVQSQEGALVISRVLTGTQTHTTHSYISTPISDTQGKWKYLEAVLDLPLVKSEAGLLSTDNISFSVYAVNYDVSKYLLVDDIRMQPYEASSMQTFVYDQIFDLPSSASNARSIPTRSNYDYYGREVDIRDENLNIIKKTEYNSVEYLEEPLIDVYKVNGFNVPQHIYHHSTISFKGYGYSNKSDVTYQWDFGDPTSGSSNTSTLQNPDHDFNIQGDFTVTLTVTSILTGISKTTTKVVHVESHPITASIYGTDHFDFPHVPISAHSGYGNYHVTAVAGGCGAYTYNWEVESGMMGIDDYPNWGPNLTNVFWSYDDTGPGQVRCTVTDSYGNEVTLSVDVTFTLVNNP